MVVAKSGVVPAGRGGSSSPYVARITRIVRGSGLPNELHAMGTIVEGEWEEVPGLIRACARDLEKDPDRISVDVRTDWRRGRKARIAEKLAAVEPRLPGTARGATR